MKKNIIISAINFTSGGGLTIVNECLSYLSTFVKNNSDYKIIAIVYDKSLCYYADIEYIEYKKAKNSWLFRLYAEYVYFYKLSKQLNPYLWLSLHDVSPNVRAEKRVVYCHNPFPFYNFQFKDLYFNYKVVILTLFYKYIYKINIKKNLFVVVQQNWMRNEFIKLFSLKKEKIIVAYPENKFQHSEFIDTAIHNYNQEQIKTFFYPVLSRPFKNFEIICEASKILKDRHVFKYKILLTIDGSEENYSKYIVNKYKNDDKIDFTGLISFYEVQKLYKTIDCLLFPSKLETWGLPVSEFAVYQKPMIISDLQYAHETASGAELVAFFNPNDPNELANLMEDVINDNLEKFKTCKLLLIDPPFTKNWQNLFEIILNS